MKTTSRIAALALVVALGGAPVLAAKKPEAAATGADAKNLSKPVRTILVEAQKLEAAGDAAGTLAQLRTAEAAGGLNPTDLFFISQMKLGVGNKLKDQAVLEEGVKGSLASNLLPATEKPKYIGNLAALALQRNDYNGATQAYEQLTVLTPNDPGAFATLGELYARQKQSAKAIDALGKSIALSKAAGQPAEERVYQQQLQIAYDSKLQPQIASGSEALVGAYPTPANWRNVLLIFRDSAKLDDQGNLDVFRLMQSAGALNGERDYAEFTETLIGKGLPGEAKTVLGEGVAKGMVSTSKSYYVDYNKSINLRLAPDKASLPALDKEARSSAAGKSAMGLADAYFGYADYARAAEFYRMALAKGGVDTATANLRLGAALARSGDKAGAASALAAVKGGARETLAGYWTIWLGQKA